jgi:hypothetical protein
MHIRLLEPPNGWTGLGFEFVTIVVGVLVALAAQELVQSLHWRREVEETRKALDAEVARDAAAFQYRMNQRPCVEQRLTELVRWVDSHRSGKPLALKKGITAPPGFELRSAAWDVTDGEIATRIPLQVKMSYATIYDSMKSFDELTDSEQAQWSTLQQFENADRLQKAELRTIGQAIREIGSMNEALAGYKIAIDGPFKQLKISPEKDIEARSAPIIAKWNRELCEPLL